MTTTKENPAVTVNVYSIGILACSVCAPPEMTREEVEKAVNAMNPTGVDSQWRVSDEPFRTGEPNPLDVDGCGRHWLLVC